MFLHLPSALLCTTTCGTIQDVPAPYDDCAVDVFKTFGANYLIFVKCDYQFTDMLDTAEWTTAITANNIHVTPAGKVTPNVPTNTPFEIEGCGREAPGEVEMLIDYETYQTSTTNADDTYFNDVFTNARSWRLMWIDCNDDFALKRAWKTEIAGGAPASVAGDTPGFEFSITQPPAKVEGEQRNQKWTFQLKIKLSNELVAYSQIAGVPAILG